MRRLELHTENPSKNTHLQVRLNEKVMGTCSHIQKRCTNAVPTGSCCPTALLCITQTNQLTIIIRQVITTNYEPVERFFTFIKITSHTGQNLADTLLQYLTEH